MKRWLVAALLVGSCWWPRGLRAQADTTIYHAPTPSWVTPWSLTATNVLLSAVTAGVTQELRGGSFKDGFTRGALGGIFLYAGKRVAVEDFGGAGLLGRQLNAVGASLVRNASDGVGAFDRFVLPIGIARVYWQRGAQPGWQVKLDALAVGWTMYGVVESELDFNFHRTLSAGTPVFQTRGKVISFDADGHAGGIAQSGVVFLSDVRPWGNAFLEKAFAHERVHVLQLDQIFLTLNEPHDDRVLRWLPGGPAVNQWVDINVSTEFLNLLATMIDGYRDRPWELEAIYLTR